MRLETRDFLPNGEPGDRYWGGVAVGAFVGATTAAIAFLAANAVSRHRDHRIMRLEDSIQIARPVEDVFRAWSDFAHLPDYIDAVQHVDVQGSHSLWTVHSGGRRSRWQAETVQFIPNEAIGWKSVSGPKHTGRITFTPLEDQTIVHVTMNYASPLGRFSMLADPASGAVSSVINEALRDFKASVEGRRTRTARGDSSRYGSRSAREVEWREGSKDISLAKETLKQPATVDYTRPPKAKYP